MNTLHAPELRPVGQVPCTETKTGLLIGCAHRRPMPELSADAERLQAALLSKPRSRPVARSLLGLLGSTSAVLALIALFAAALLLTACGPSDTEAAADAAADLRDAQQQAQIEHHMALALLAASGHK